MAVYRPPEYCFLCGKELIVEYHPQTTQPFFGDLFKGYKPCNCKSKLPKIKNKLYVR